MVYYQKVDDNKILSEVNSTENKPVILEGRDKPYEKLNDREFEVLSYYLFKKNKVGMNKEYDNIDLMQGVGEKGRDCILYKNGEVAGIIQCKHTEKNSRMDKTAAFKEIIKFALNCIKDKTIIPKDKMIDYHFVHSFAFSHPAQEMLNNFYNKAISNLVELEELTNKVISRYSNLSDLEYDVIHDELIGILKRLNVIKYERQDLDLLITNHSEILSIFFKVQEVIIKDPSLPRQYEAVSPKNEEVKKIYENENFISKLKEIEIQPKDIIQAIKDYWSMLRTLELVYSIEYFDEDEIETYQKDLILKYSNQYNKNRENISEGDKLRKIKSESRKFYWDIMNQNPIKIIGLSDNRPFFQNGIYQDLANSNKIETWMLKHVSEGVNYEDIYNFI